ncbi:MAG: beta-3-deoxy-D-manno-oct-2-ulosonic acid transferase [Pseudomonadota bacterium]
MRSPPAASTTHSTPAWVGLALAPDPRAGGAMAALRPFFPEFAWTQAPGAAAWLLAEDAPPPSGPGPRILRAGPGPWPWPRFGTRIGRAALLVAERPAPGPVGPPDGSAASAFDSAGFLAALRQARVAGPAGLPDPGAAGIGIAPGSAVLVLDPCRPSLAAAALAMWNSAVGSAAGRPVIAVRMTPGPATLPDARGPMAAWTLIEAAAEWHLLEDTGLATIAAAAGVAIHAHAPLPGFADASEAPLARFARLVAATRFADPFRAAPCSAEAALEIMAEWQRAAAGNARIAVACGMAWWKRARIGAALATDTGPPAFRHSASGAVAEARRRGGAIAVWATREPRGLRAAAAKAGVEVLRVEDGFLRSAGLGAGFLPGGSIAIDARGVAYDPTAPSDLEVLLQAADFSFALLARAALLRAVLVGRGVTKYNLPGAAAPPEVAPGRTRVLVPGQVEDDASVRLGAMAGPCTNLDLLRAARAAEPGAFILYRPHPDVAAGFRAGRVPPAAALAIADAVQEDAAMPALLDWADTVHTITSLTGFEALLRGKRVVCHGMPFYAGWGLTEDRQSVPRRTCRLSLDALVAGALIAYPRCIDPVTELPCPPEILVERLTQPQHWQAGRVAVLRRMQGRLMGALARRGWLR